MDTATVARPVEMIPLAAVRPAPDNPRANVGDVSELAMSIKEVGVRNPILVIDRGDHFEIVAGERRLAAAQLAGLDEMPAIVEHNMAEDERVLVMAIENLQREDLTPLEEAHAYERLLETLACSQRDLAPRVGKTQSHISKRLALLQLPKDVQGKVDSGGIAISDAVELAKLADHPKHLKKALESSPWQDVATRVKHQLGEIDVEKKGDEVQQTHEANGLKVIRGKRTYNLPKGLLRLKSGSSDYYHDALQITAKQHAKHPCHAMYVATEYGKVHSIPVCTDRSHHPDIKTRGEEQRAKATGNGGSAFRAPAEDKTSAQLREAREARLGFVNTLLAKKPPKGVLQLILQAFVHREVEYGDINVDDLVVRLGVATLPEPSDDDPKPELDPSIDARALLAEFVSQGEAQLQRAALAVAIEIFDGLYSGIVDSRLRFAQGTTGDDVITRAYLEFLRGAGHELHDLEQKKLDLTTEAAAMPTAA